MRLVLKYGSSVWDPFDTLLQEELEKVQKRAARFVIINYTYETGRDSRIIMLYKDLKGAASIPTNDQGTFNLEFVLWNIKVSMPALYHKHNFICKLLVRFVSYRESKSKIEFTTYKARKKYGLVMVFVN